VNHGIHPGNKSLDHSGVLGRAAWNFIGHLRRRNLGGWLYDLLKPHAAHVVACNPGKNPALNQGNRSDKIDARELANRLRLNDLKPV